MDTRVPGRGAKRAAEDTNASRNVRRHFARRQLTLPIKIRRVQHTAGGDVSETHWIAPSDWLRLLVGRYPHCVFGNVPTPNVGQQLKAFWEMYRGYNAAHPVFTQHAAELDATIPLQLFGDEGRGQKRGNFLLWSVASPLGLSDMPKDWECDCSDQLQTKPASQLDGCAHNAVLQASDADIQRALKQSSNYKGHSYVTRHLIFGMPHWTYKKFPWVVDKHMLLLSSDLGVCFRDGLQINGRQFFAAVIGSKGDMKHQMEFGNLNRSYHTLSKGKSSSHMCSLCLAGEPGLPFEDASDEPKWARTLFASRPWSSLPNILTDLPHNPREAEEFFQLDLFHLIKVGLGRDVAGSGVAVLAQLGFYDWDDDGSKNLASRLQRAHHSFSLWCAGANVKPGLRSFTAAFLSIKSRKSYPWMNTKGSDTMHVVKYLLWFCSLEIHRPSSSQALQNQRFLKLLKHTSENLLQAFQIIHSHGLWLSRDCAKHLYSCFMLTLRGYKALAKDCLARGLCGFAMKPKFHGIHHIAHKLRQDLLAGNDLVLSPVCWMCEQDEDKVGKCSRLSRRISVRNQTEQILERYLLKKKALLCKSKAKSC